MATEITMPKLSDTMTEGRLISWKRSVGEKVERGDVIAEVETDKANMELESYSSGTLLETRVKAGEMVAVGTVIGLVGEPGEKPAAPAAKVEEKREEKEPAAPKVELKPAEVKAEEAPVPREEEGAPIETSFGAKVPQVAVPPEVKKEAVSGEVKQAPQKEEKGEPETERAAPVVRRLARDKGVDLHLVKGSGPDGRILREDVEKFILQKSPENKEQPRLQPEEPQPLVDETVPLSRMRAAIARTVVTSWREIPHFTVTVEIDMADAERVVRTFKSSGHRVSLNDVIIKGVAAALKKYPSMNASYTEEGVAMHAAINIGIAVSVENGLLVPVVKGCQSLSLPEVADQSRDLIDRARSGKLNEHDLSGGTFTISNLGMFGVEEFMAIIFPPQVAILAVGAVIEKPAVKNGTVAVGRFMSGTISADHRVVDGAYAAKFMAELKRVLENPLVMLL